MKDRSDDPSHHERTLLSRSYISLPGVKEVIICTILPVVVRARERNVLFNDALLVSAFAHGAMGGRIDPSWGGPIELFLVPASAPRLV